MAETTQKKDITSSTLLKFVLILTSVAMVNDMIIYPAAESIYVEYGASTSMFVLNSIISGGGLFCVFGSILAGVWAQFTGKKTILAISYAIWVLSTIPNAFIGDPTAIMVLRFISGLGMGLVTTASAGLIAELFVDEKSRSRLMGFYMSAMGLVGMVVSYASGTLAVTNWHNVFWLYLIGVPILVGIICVVPKTAPEGRKAKEEAAASAPAAKTNWGPVVALIIATFVYNACFGVLFTMNSVYIAEQGLGDASTSGMMTTLISLGSMVASFCFGWLFMKFKRALPVLFAIVMTIGFACFAYSTSLGVLYVAITLMGAMYGISYTYFLTYASFIVPPSKVSLSIGLVNAAVSLAFFFGPYVAPLYEGAFHVSTYATAMPFIGATTLIYAIISLVLVILYKKKFGTLDPAGPGAELDESAAAAETSEEAH